MSLGGIGGRVWSIYTVIGLATLLGVLWQSNEVRSGRLQASGPSVERRGDQKAAAEGDLLSTVLAGIDACRERVSTGEFEATETATMIRPDGTSTESGYRMREVFDRAQNKVRHEVFRKRRSITLSRRAADPPGKQDATKATSAEKMREMHGVWLALPDASALWIDDNGPVSLLPAEKLNGVVAYRPFDPIAAGLMTPDDVSHHAPYKYLKTFLSEHRAKGEVTAARDGGDFLVDVRYRVVDKDGTIVETDRRSWIDPAKNFGPVRTELRWRVSKNGKTEEWSSPSTTKVEWKKINGVFVPVSIEAARHISAGNRTLKTAIQLRWKQVNGPVDQKEFDYHLLNAPRKTVVIDRRNARLAEREEPMIRKSGLDATSGEAGQPAKSPRSGPTTPVKADTRDVVQSIAVEIKSVTAGTQSTAVDGPTLTGKVCEEEGKPVAGATVMIWTGAVKQGYSVHCPGCYQDCGKRATTDAQGTFAIPRLSPDLRFQLLVVREGYTPAFVGKVDPFQGPAAATLHRRETPADLSRVVRGRIIGPNREPVRGAVIEPEFVWFHKENGELAGWGGAVKGLDPLAVANDRGEFEVAYAKPAVRMTLMVRARGMAPKRFDDLSTGSERHTMSVDRGASVRGRLVHYGKPVGGAEMGLVSRDRVSDRFISEVRIGTEPDGSFLFVNVPAPGQWYAYAKMESIARYGATPAVACATDRDDEIVDLGAIEIKSGHGIRGRVVLSDGKSIPDGMRIGISAQRAWDSQTLPLGSDGRFEFVGLPSDDYAINPGIKGYHLSETNPNLSWSIEGVIDHDIDDFVIVLDPGKANYDGRFAGKFRGQPLKSAAQP